MSNDGIIDYSLARISESQYDEEQIHDSLIGSVTSHNHHYDHSHRGLEARQNSHNELEQSILSQINPFSDNELDLDILLDDALHNSLNPNNSSSIACKNNNVLFENDVFGLINNQEENFVDFKNKDNIL